jgi:hypothetical protein
MRLEHPSSLEHGRQSFLCYICEKQIVIDDKIEGTQHLEICRKQKKQKEDAAAISAMTIAVTGMPIAKKLLELSSAVATVPVMPNIQIKFVPKLPEVASGTVATVPGMPNIRMRVVNKLPEGCVPVPFPYAPGGQSFKLVLPEKLVMEQAEEMNAKKQRLEEDESLKGDEPEILTCHLCDYREVRRGLRQHYEGNHNMKYMKFCVTKGCDYRTQIRSEIRDHRYQERGRTQCDICGKLVIGMRSHLATHNTDVSYDCDNCKRTYKRLDKLR